MVTDAYGFDRAADARFGPVIDVRWVENLRDARRTALERALRLYRAEHREGSTWRYQAPDVSPDRLRAMVAHDMVADTGGFDRGSLELDASAGDISQFTDYRPNYTSGWHPAESDATAPESTWRWTQRTATLSFANPNADAAFYLGLRRPAGRLRRRPADGHGHRRRPGAAVIPGRRGQDGAFAVFPSPPRCSALGTRPRFRSPWTGRSCRQPSPPAETTNANWAFKSITRSSCCARPHAGNGSPALGCRGQCTERLDDTLGL